LFREDLLNLGEVGVRLRRDGLRDALLVFGRLRNLEEASNDVLGLTNREVFRGDPRRERGHRLLIAEREDGTRVAGGDLLVGQELLNVQRKREEPDRVRDV